MGNKGMLRGDGGVAYTHTSWRREREEKGRREIVVIDTTMHDFEMK
jgi:hypothetical protein